VGQIAMPHSICYSISKSDQELSPSLPNTFLTPDP
jgi:hypothetical protein